MKPADSKNSSTSSRSSASFDEALAPLVQALQASCSLCSLTSLDLGYNRGEALANEHAEALAEALKVNRDVNSVNLSENEIGDKMSVVGRKTLAEAIAYCEVIDDRKITITGNGAGSGDFAARVAEYKRYYRELFTALAKNWYNLPLELIHAIIMPFLSDPDTDTTKLVSSSTSSSSSASSSSISAASRIGMFAPSASSSMSQSFGSSDDKIEMQQTRSSAFGSSR